MPPAWAGLVDSRMRLTDAERARLASGLQATFNTTPVVPTPVSASNNTNVVLLVAIGIVLVVLALAFVAGPRQVRPLEQFSARRNP